MNQSQQQKPPVDSSITERIQHGVDLMRKQAQEIGIGVQRAKNRLDQIKKEA